MNKEALKEMKRDLTGDRYATMKRHYLDVANDLALSDEILRKIFNAKTEFEIQRILCTARKRNN